MTDAGGPDETATTNRLADTKSPYLLQHADNPVDWYPWGPEAFARAEEEDMNSERCYQQQYRPQWDDFILDKR